MLKDFFLIATDHKSYKTAFEGDENKIAITKQAAYEAYKDAIHCEEWSIVLAFRIEEGNIRDITEEFEEWLYEKSRETDPAEAQKLTASDLGVGQYGAFAR